MSAGVCVGCIALAPFAAPLAKVGVALRRQQDGGLLDLLKNVCKSLAEVEIFSHLRTSVLEALADVEIRFVWHYTGLPYDWCICVCDAYSSSDVRGLCLTLRPLRAAVRTKPSAPRCRSRRSGP